MKKKYIKIIILVILAAIISLVIYLLVLRSLAGNENNNATKVIPIETFTPEFMSASEKEELKLPAESKAQIIKRDAQGGVMVYKLIKNETDAVNPAKIGPISPRIK